MHPESGPAAPHHEGAIPPQGSWLTSHVARGLATASVGLGFFSMVVFWWYPFGLMLASAGLFFGLVCLGLRVRGREGQNMALVGATLSALSFGAIITLTKVLHVLTWDR
jgi:hypothetical protein